jgi:hypothetical protein
VVLAPGTLEARADRWVEAAVAVVLLAAFVFRQPLFVPVVGLLLAIGAAVGPSGDPLHIAYTSVISPRLPPLDDRIAVAVVRAQDAVGAVLLGVASLAFLVDIAVLGWLFTLAVAALTAVAASTGFHVGELLLRRLRRDDDH